jgi:hypothetical protein
MHRVVTQAVQGQEVDHINGDRLDNRRENLRIVTRSQNAMNRKWNGSKPKGVSRNYNPRSLKPFTARIQFNGKPIFLGNFSTVEEAAQAYNEAAAKYFGEYARAAG